MAEVHKLDDNSFDAEVMQSETPVLVDFGAPWCGPCKQLDPIMDELATQHDGQLKVAKVNVQDCPGVASKYGVMALPTLFFVKGGEITEKVTGRAPSKADLDKMVANLLG